jgi:pimeloyl-ACP methyl ester carboxylesterase
MSPTQTVRFIRDADGARVAYAIVGEGPLILCPAWWVSHVERDWEHPGFRHFFTRLAEGFRVVRYDRPGSGLSDIPDRRNIFRATTSPSESRPSVQSHTSKNTVSLSPCRRTSKQ